MTPEGLVVDLAGFRVALHARGPLRAELEAAYAAFLTAQPPEVSLHIDASGAATPLLPQRPLPQVRSDGPALILEGDGYFATVEGNSGTLRSREERFPVDMVLRVLLARRALEQDGLVLHACSLALGDDGFVFVGRSGAGKSSLSRLVEPEGVRTLSDELCVARWEGAALRVHATPWNLAAPSCAALRAIGVLAHSARHELTAFSGATVLREVLENVLLPDASAQTRHRVFRLASRMVQQVAPVRLAFSLSAGLGEVLRRFSLDE